MRVFKQGQKISVHAIAGTQVVFLGLNARPDAAENLLGFEIRCSLDEDHRWLFGGRKFKYLISREGKRADSRTAPIQALLWGDYEAEPGTKYVYTVTAKYGSPGALRDGDSVSVEVTTENPDDGDHGVFFNRGVAGSQAYSRAFSQHRR